MKLMHKIYSSAEQVLIWLGISHKAIRSLMRIADVGKVTSSIRRYVDIYKSVPGVRRPKPQQGDPPVMTATPRNFDLERRRRGGNNGANTRLTEGVKSLTQHPYWKRVWSKFITNELHSILNL